MQNYAQLHLGAVPKISNIIKQLMKYNPKKFVNQYSFLVRHITKQSLPKHNDSAQVQNFVIAQSNNMASIREKSRDILKSWYKQSTDSLLGSIKHVKFVGPFFGSLNHLKFYHTDYFQTFTAEYNSKKMQQLSAVDLLKIYRSSVNLKNPNNNKLFNHIIPVIMDKLQRQKQSIKSGIVSCVMLANIFSIDQSVQTVEKNRLIQQINSILTDKFSLVKQLVEKDNRFKILLLRLFQKTKLYDLKFSPNIYYTMLQVHQKIDKIEQDRDEETNTKQMNSTFEKVFTNRLTDLGYMFDSSVQIKGNQYDLIINGTYKQKVRPFQNIRLDEDISQRPSYCLKKAHTIAKSKDRNYIENKQFFANKVVLGLNGPIHYIQSNVATKYTITREQQFNYQKLSLYGFQKYNLVNFEQWEQKDKSQNISEEYIKNLISRPLDTFHIAKPIL